MLTNCYVHINYIALKGQPYRIIKRQRFLSNSVKPSEFDQVIVTNLLQICNGVKGLDAQKIFNIVLQKSYRNNCLFMKKYTGIQTEMCESECYKLHILLMSLFFFFNRISDTIQEATTVIQRISPAI